MIPFQRPSLPATPEIDRYLDLSRGERWFSNGGPCWRLLRDRLGDRVGAFCVPVASGTLGLMVAISSAAEAAGARTGRTPALMPSFTFLATAQAARWTGFTPTLLDIAPDHWHLDAGSLERALHDGDEAGVVIAVSAFGTPPPAETRSRWESACRRQGVPLVVDSAAGFGALADDGVAIGAQGDVEVVSFHATKPFAIGEGGAVFTRDRALHDRIEHAVNFGFRADRTVATARGINAKMSELHAATALAVLDRLDSILERRRSAAGAIRARARDAISWQAGCERSTWQFVPIAMADPAERELIAESCRDRIEVRAYYDPLDELMPDDTAVGERLPNTADLHRRILSLPMANDLSEAEIGVLGTALEER